MRIAAMIRGEANARAVFDVLNGRNARKACRAWLRDLRIIRQLEKEIAP